MTPEARTMTPSISLEMIKLASPSPPAMFFDALDGCTASTPHASSTCGARPAATTKTPQPKARVFARLQISRANNGSLSRPTSARATEAAESSAPPKPPAVTREAAEGSRVTSATIEPSRRCETLNRERSTPAARARMDSRSARKAAMRPRTKPKSAATRSTTRWTWASGALQVGPTRVRRTLWLSPACSSSARGSVTLPSWSSRKGSEAT
mmetsp:Transcript_55255/g.173254  ORF Transcript_55255/g.173254 Transcript_55255/m.173254 type:complete len:211 (+) Transcript_55255:251-883(+)